MPRTASDPAFSRESLVKGLKTTKPDNAKVVDMFKPIPANFEGSLYGHTEIRASGSKEFCELVLSNFKSILSREDDRHQVRIMYRPVEKGKKGKATEFVAYLRLVERPAKKGRKVKAKAAPKAVSAKKKTKPVPKAKKISKPKAAAKPAPKKPTKPSAPPKARKPSPPPSLKSKATAPRMKPLPAPSN